MKHKGVRTYAIDPPVVECACGEKIVVRRPGLWREHLALNQAVSDAETQG